MSEDKCVICLEQLEAAQRAGVSGCAHEFCLCCIQDWARVTNLCPVCRLPFTRIRPRGEEEAADDTRTRDRGRGRRRKSIQVAAREQRVRYEDTGMGLLDPFLGFQDELPIPRNFMEDYEFEYEDPSGFVARWAALERRESAGRRAYSRPSLETALMGAVYGAINNATSSSTTTFRRPRRVRTGSSRRRLPGVVINTADLPPSTTGDSSEGARRMSSRAVMPGEHEIIDLVDSDSDEGFICASPSLGLDSVVDLTRDSGGAPEEWMEPSPPPVLNRRRRLKLLGARVTPALDAEESEALLHFNLEYAVARSPGS